MVDFSTVVLNESSTFDAAVESKNSMSVVVDEAGEDRTKSSAEVGGGLGTGDVISGLEVPPKIRLRISFAET